MLRLEPSALLHQQHLCQTDLLSAVPAVLLAASDTSTCSSAYVEGRTAALPGTALASRVSPSF